MNNGIKKIYSEKFSRAIKINENFPFFLILRRFIIFAAIPGMNQMTFVPFFWVGKKKSFLLRSRMHWVTSCEIAFPENHKRKQKYKKQLKVFLGGAFMYVSQ